MGAVDLADARARLVAEALDPLDRAEVALADVVEGLVPAPVAAALGAVLDDALVLVRGLDALAAFPDLVADRLFDVDVLAGLAGPDGDERVPVVGRGGGDGVDFLVVEELADVARSP